MESRTRWAIGSGLGWFAACGALLKYPSWLAVLLVPAGMLLGWVMYRYEWMPGQIRRVATLRRGGAAKAEQTARDQRLRTLGILGMLAVAAVLVPMLKSLFGSEGYMALGAFAGSCGGTWAFLAARNASPDLDDTDEDPWEPE